MGAVYSIDLKVKFKNERRTLKTLQDFLSTTFSNYSPKDISNKGLNPNSVEDIIRFLLVGYEKHNNFTKEPSSNGFTLYTSDFNASYTWEVILMKFFNAISPCLQDGSSIYIEPDNDYDKAVIRNG